ncbi:S41 family peptidase [Deinococcus pimensis]|uniref:S41 family peptidase n=1 Tax=Deinococcus pimensis TaxID=309888 RepID=UPI000480894B|nr:S41 family peptidase [Deinococcus pimensis]
MRRSLTVLALLTLGVTHASGADDFLFTPAAQVWLQATSALRSRYVGPGEAQLPALLTDAERRLQAICAGVDFDPGTCDENLATSVLARALRLLGDPHTHLVPVDHKTPKDDAGFTARETSVGTVVTTVTPGSTVDHAGLRRGDVVDVPALLAAFDRAGVKTGQSKPAAFTVLRQGRKVTLHATTRLQRRPTLPYLTKTTTPGTSVLTIPTFAYYPQVARQVHNLVRQANEQGVRRLVVDLRGNHGGGGCFEAAGAFVPSYTLVERTRSAVETARVVNGVFVDAAPVLQGTPSTLFTGKVVVLVNDLTASCGEVFALVLQHEGRARVVGQMTAGAADTQPVDVSLGAHEVLWMSVARHGFDEVTPYPHVVAPDVVVRDDVVTLARSGRDVPMERALAELDGQ